jgi:hypothetical protein
MHSVGHAVTTVMTLIIGLAFNVISKHIINHQITFIAIKPSFVLHLHAVMRKMEEKERISDFSERERERECLLS